MSSAQVCLLLSFFLLFFLSWPPKSSLSFDQLLQATPLPNPGPEYYAARRNLWLTAPLSPLPRPLPSAAASASRQKLQDVTSQPGAAYDQEIWDHSLEKVWKGLSSGGKLKVGLPLASVVCACLPFASYT